MRENKKRVPIIDDRPMTYKDFKAIMDKWDKEDQDAQDDKPEKKLVTA